MFMHICMIFDRLDSKDDGVGDDKKVLLYCIFAMLDILCVDGATACLLSML